MHASTENIDDLLIPEAESRASKANSSHAQDKIKNEDNNLDELLGPIDIFPFLPDNHRDSGTGKFNGF